MFRKISRIPPHIFWPGLVIGILGVSFVANIVLVLAAQSHGGAAVVPDYYQKSTQWDEQQQQLAESRSLGWNVDFRVSGEPGRSRPLEITVTDADGAPVEGLEGTFELRHPMKAEPVSTAALKGAEQRPGVYVVAVALTHHGVWDFEVDAKRGDDHFILRKRKEVGR